jgi:hypothetical protein
LIEKGFYEENLDALVVECNALAQDTSYALPFFVLKHVFLEMAAIWESGAVRVDAHNDLICGITDDCKAVLDKAVNGEEIEAADLEQLVRTHLRNVNVFRSEQ